MNKKKEKTYTVAFAESHSVYYVVKAVDEEEAYDRAYEYDDSQEWALDSWDNGIESRDHGFTEENKE